MQTQVQTSSDSPIEVDFLPLTELGISGRIGLTLAPGQLFVDSTTVYDRDLVSDLNRLRQVYGINQLVCLLEPEELDSLGISHLLAETEATGMTTEWLPISDEGVPDSMPEFAELVERVVQTVSSGSSVVIHCRGGRGRTGMLAACCLVQLGHDPELAIQTVQQIRTGALQAENKRQYIHQFASI